MFAIYVRLVSSRYPQLLVHHPSTLHTHTHFLWGLPPLQLTKVGLQKTCSYYVLLTPLTAEPGIKP